MERSSLKLLEDAKLQYQGHVTDKTQWNTVHIGNQEFCVQRAPMVKAKVNIDDLRLNNISDNHPNAIGKRERCFLQPMNIFLTKAYH